LPTLEQTDRLSFFWSIASHRDASFGRPVIQSQESIQLGRLDCRAFDARAEGTVFGHGHALGAAAAQTANGC
jgi:hypothetical protein